LRSSRFSTGPVRRRRRGVDPSGTGFPAPVPDDSTAADPEGGGSRGL